VPVDSGERLIGLIRAAVPAGQVIGVALSGGGDSVALLHLCRAAGLSVEAVTVDHRLRPESAAEAASVGAACAALGLRHEVLVWDHGAVGGNLMDQARRARMALIGAWARSRGIGIVLLGHTRDDQAETVLMGLARAAGIDGLAGMRQDWQEGGLRFLRPLLEAGRAELRDWLRAQGVGWIDDPTNEDDRFSRVRARRALLALRPLGITAEGLAAVAGHLAEAQAALQVQVAEAAARVLREVAGALVLDRAEFALLPGEVRRRLVVAAVRWLSGGGYGPRADAVARLEAALAEGRDATLSGCRLRGGVLMREVKAVAATVSAPGALWDGRWALQGPVLPGAEVRALGMAGLRACPGWRATGLAREVLAVTPSVWLRETLVSAPLAGLANGWQARIDAPFHLFGLSH
jgi:tRNA(Ile)-lysidine synthase